MEDKIYHYIGPIKRFGKVVAKEWEGETTAPSLSKAVNNLKFQAKKYLGLTKDAKVELNKDGIIEMSGLDEEETKEYNRSYDPDYDIPDEWEGSYEDDELRLRDYIKDSDDDVYDVYYEDKNTHKQGSFKRRTWNQVERLQNNKNLRIIAVSPSEDENKQYSIDFYYNIYYVDMDNTYEEEKKALKEEYLPRYNLKLIEFAEIHDGGPDNCRITLKGTKSDLEKFIYDMDENPEDYQFKARDTKFKDTSNITFVYPGATLYEVGFGNKPVKVLKVNKGALNDIYVETKAGVRLWTKSSNYAGANKYFMTPEEYKKTFSKKFKDVEPRKGEKKDDFISRFMSATKKEYPDYKQRLAVAYSYWNRAKGIKD